MSVNLASVATTAKTHCLFCSVQWMFIFIWGLQSPAPSLLREMGHFPSLAAQAPHKEGADHDIWLSSICKHLSGSFWNFCSGFSFCHNCTKAAFWWLLIVWNGVPAFIKSNCNCPWETLTGPLSPNFLPSCWLFEYYSISWFLALSVSPKFAIAWVTWFTSNLTMGFRIDTRGPYYWLGADCRIMSFIPEVKISLSSPQKCWA